jgi:hypothetical protein
VDARESVDSVGQHGANAGTSRRESIRAVLCAVAALILSLGAVAGIHAIVDDDGSDAATRLAVSESAAQRAGDHHSGSHSSAKDAAAGGAHAHSGDADNSLVAHQGNHSDGGGSTHNSSAHAGATSSAHGHTSTGGSNGTASAGHDHAETTPGSTTGGDHTHTPPPDGSGSTTPTTGHQHTTPPPDGGTTTPTTSGHDHDPPPSGPVQLADLPPDIRAQVTSVRDWAMQYPTAQSATAAGYQQITVFFHGIAAHYLNFSLLDSTFDPAHPEVLLYGEQGQLVGVNYIVYSGASPPEGFPGDLDGWHEHPVLCRSTSSGLIIAAEETTAAQCAAMGGVQFSFAGYYLLHVWCIPGWESPEGIFSHENSRI